MSTITVIVVPTWVIVAGFGVLAIAILVSAWEGYWARRAALADEDLQEAGFERAVFGGRILGDDVSPAPQAGASRPGGAHASGA